MVTDARRVLADIEKSISHQHRGGRMAEIRLPIADYWERKNSEPVLPVKQQLFINEYLVCLCAKEAAIAAGYSEKSANETGKRLLRHAPVARVISRELTARTGIGRPFVVDALARLARASIDDVMSWGPKGVKIKDSKDLTPEQKEAIAKVTVSANGEVRVEMYDRIAALRELGKALGLYNESSQTNVQINISHEDALRELE
jgi:phage terminase small subunit